MHRLEQRTRSFSLCRFQCAPHGHASHRQVVGFGLDHTCRPLPLGHDSGPLGGSKAEGRHSLARSDREQAYRHQGYHAEPSSRSDAYTAFPLLIEMFHVEPHNLLGQDWSWCPAKRAGDDLHLGNLSFTQDRVGACDQLAGEIGDLGSPCRVLGPHDQDTAVEADGLCMAGELLPRDFAPVPVNTCALQPPLPATLRRERGHLPRNGPRVFAQRFDPRLTGLLRIDHERSLEASGTPVPVRDGSEVTLLPRTK